ncbi:hypothetical protein [Evansella tamaricis]|uniref:Uncharacterized protein n=1 Tax=Evansella tamaricis TaxID=2069301 RepID=A0ABS6JL31_9BACI|nr:hypothetical protein [Evansella tamaricis]MBU9714090.1 hypothetical protein [Evansella tamaricis]
MKVKINILLVFLMLFITFVPSVQAVQTTGTEGNNGLPDYVTELNSKDKEKIIDDAIRSSEFKSFVLELASEYNINHLREQTYVRAIERGILDSQVYKMEVPVDETEKIEGYTLTLDIELSKKYSTRIMLIYVDGNIEIGGGLTSDNSTIYLYELKDFELINSGTITNADKPELKQVEVYGISVESNATCGPTGDVGIQQSWGCSSCINVFNTIHDLGCGIASALLCTFACAPIGGLTCPIVCGILYAAVCVFNNYGSRQGLQACQDFGPC